MVRFGSLCMALGLTLLATPLAAQSPPIDFEPPAEDSAVRAVGRLVLPWGRHDSSRMLALALKNDSRRNRRVFRVVFFLPGGEPAAATDEMAIPPRGSLALPLDDLLEPGIWEAGSVEVHYTGPGGGRLIGTARQVDLALAQSEIQPLVQAQFRVTQR